MTSGGQKTETYPISGVPVQFPCKPYSTQLQMMSKIIQALQKGQNALLESPTGSGKSLALLCSTLAWQQHSSHLLTLNSDPEVSTTEDTTFQCHCTCHSDLDNGKQSTCMNVTEPTSDGHQSADIQLATFSSPAGHHQLHVATGSSTGHSTDQQLANGLFTGQLANQLTGSSTGQLANQHTGPSTGELAHEITASSANQLTCSYTGNQMIIGSSTGQLANQLTGSSTGQLANQLTGSSAGQLAIQLTELVNQLTGPSTGQLADQLTGSAAFQLANQLIAGQLAVQSNCLLSAQVSNQATSSLPPTCTCADLSTSDCLAATISSTDNSTGYRDADVTIKSKQDCDDFKQSNKRFRTPARKGTKKLKRAKGVVFDDLNEESVCSTDSQLVSDEHGHPTWRMTLKHEPQMMATVSHSPSVAAPQSTSVEKPSTNKSNLLVTTTESCGLCGCELNGNNKKPCPSDVQSATPKRVRIYYGTRTHKQIAQIVHELAKTAYSSTPMVILASREHTCVHPRVSMSRNKKEDCKKLVEYREGVSCPFYHKVQQKLGQQAKLKEYGYNTAWDIEDLVKLGRKVKACPYYATRALLDGADIVFCPYNYLIDPLIRQQMLIDLKGSVLVLDEAHNMEDAAREATSLAITTKQLRDVEEELTQVLSRDFSECRESYQVINVYVHNLAEWMESNADDLNVKRYEEACSVWNGRDFLPYLGKIGITIETHSVIMSHIDKIRDKTFEQQDRENPEANYTLKLTVGALHVIESVFIILGYLFVQSHKHIEDYRIALKKNSVMLPQKTLGMWIKRHPVPLERVWVITLYLWCLNPAVAFSELQSARSIILTSGTLSPMNTFSSELGIKFPIQLEANHVISQSQTWVCTISRGPNGHPINGSYQFVDTFQFQDEIGMAILEICKVVPFGVLCFVSSYKLLEKLSSRWQNTGIWYQMLKTKHIVCEPRAGSKEEFEIAMSQFYERIQAASNREENETSDSEFIQNGALFFAVCRGKVSEGLDFTDNNARAVITVGIPFPSIKDEQVALKKEYNNSFFYHRGLLSGSEWYQIQAYRALNQALGRCIRHKKDWGALILIDERFGRSDKYVKGLSKWVRQRVKHQPDFGEAIKSLRIFTQTRLHDSAVLNESLLNATIKEQPSLDTRDHSLVAVSSASVVGIPLSCSTPERDSISPTSYVPSPHYPNPVMVPQIQSLQVSNTIKPGNSMSSYVGNTAVNGSKVFRSITDSSTCIVGRNSTDRDSSSSPLLFDNIRPIDHMTEPAIETYDKSQEISHDVFMIDDSLDYTLEDETLHAYLPQRKNSLEESSMEAQDFNIEFINNKEAVFEPKNAGISDKTTIASTSVYEEEPVSSRLRSAERTNTGIQENITQGEKSLSLTKKESSSVLLVCHCGMKINSVSIATAPQKLENFLSHQAGYQLSTLFSLFLPSGDVYILPASQLNSTTSPISSDRLNAVWEMGMCYSIIQCQCNQTVGVQINISENQSLNGKAIISSSQFASEEH